MTNITKQIAALKRMTPKELRAKWLEVTGEEARTGNKQALVKRLAWRMQARAEGGLSERAKRRAEQLAKDAEIRLTAPKENGTGGTRTAPLPRSKGDDRIPPLGSVITRDYKGGTVEVKVLENGFEHEGETYRTLSAAAKAVTGSHCNGYLFFRLGKYAP